ncbi:MAG: extracellular solute-binding protein [Spirochaetaceae bacterium]
MKKRFFIVACVLFFLTLPVFSNGNKEAKEDGPITLTVWDFKYGEAEAAGPVFREMDRLFMEKNPGIIIEHIAQPNDRYYEILRVAMAGGTSPDVAMFGASLINVNGEGLIDLDSSIDPWRNQIPEAIWTSCTTNKVAGDPVKVSPITIQGRGFYYNKKLFKEAGLDPEKAPIEWADFLATCEQLKAADIIPIIWGNNNPGDTGLWLLRTFLGSFYNNEDHQDFISGWDFTSPGVKTAVSMIKELKDKEYLDPKGIYTPLWMDAIEKFKAGEGAIFHGLLSDIAHWKDFSDALGEENVGYFANVNHPDAKYRDAQVFVGAGISYGIYESSKYKEAAALYLKHYSVGDAPLLYLEKTGALLPNADIDYSKTGYPIVNDIMDDVKKFSVYGGFGPKLNQQISSDLVPNLGLLLNTDEITVDDFLKEMQKSLENSQ